MATGWDLEKLMSQAAEAVTGRNVSVKFIEPISDYASAELTRSPWGAHMRINPANTYDEIYLSFCHEVGHVKHDWDKIKITNAHLSESRSKTTPDFERKIIKRSDMERRAETFAVRLAAWGKKKSWDVYVPDSLPPIFGWLQAIIKYPDIR